MSNNKYIDDLIQKVSDKADGKDGIKELARDELIKRLEDKAFKRTIPENDLIEYAKGEGIDLGTSPKTRINYLISLKAIPQTTPIFYGKSKGGTRLFHPDTIEILKFLNSVQDNFSLVDRVRILIDERMDRIKTVVKHGKFDEPSNFKEVFLETVIHRIINECLFRQETIRIRLVIVKTVFMQDMVEWHENIFNYMENFINNVADTFCAKDKDTILMEFDMIKRNKETHKKGLSELYGMAEALL